MLSGPVGNQHDYTEGVDGDKFVVVCHHQTNSLICVGEGAEVTQKDVGMILARDN